MGDIMLIITQSAKETENAADLNSFFAPIGGVVTFLVA
jgi:hypothetical protein